MKKYYSVKVFNKTVENHLSQSGKAIYFEVSKGYVSFNHEDITWFPISQLIMPKEYNDVGWGTMLIPMWIVANKRIDVEQLTELNYHGEIVEA